MLKIHHSIFISFVLLISLISLTGLNTHSVSAQGIANGSECTPYPLIESPNSFPEVKGQSVHQEVWALLFPYHLPLRANEDVKIVWRITGNGEFSALARHADGTTLLPIWGPDSHLGSSWNRPGHEWGTGFRFPKAGCWRVIVQRGDDMGEVDLLVVDPPKLEFF